VRVDAKSPFLSACICGSLIFWFRPTTGLSNLRIFSANNCDAPRGISSAYRAVKAWKALVAWFMINVDSIQSEILRTESYGKTDQATLLAFAAWGLLYGLFRNGG